MTAVTAGYPGGNAGIVASDAAAPGDSCWREDVIVVKLIVKGF